MAQLPLAESDPELHIATVQAESTVPLQYYIIVNHGSVGQV